MSGGILPRRPVLSARWHNECVSAALLDGRTGKKGSQFVSKRIYVGSLPYSTTEDQLEQLFAAFGKVTDAQVITDRFTGQAKRFAFIEMENDDEANEAINNLNGSAFGGRTLVVNEAREREARSGGGGGGGSRFGGGGGGGGGYGGGGGGGGY